ncbi:hypothetical protein ABTF50_21000, partial [Acinetobacter baumannii]
MLRHVGLDAAFHLLAVIGEGAGEGSDQADLDGFLSVRELCQQADGGRDHGQSCEFFQPHFSVSFVIVVSDAARAV